MTIDINCDMGERADIDEAAIMPWITSANVACGGHAGDEAMMERTIELARRHGVEVGAHPGYPDPANFGREEMALSDVGTRRQPVRAAFEARAGSGAAAVRR